MDVVILLVSLVVILVGAELFTNGVEWFGHRLNLAEGAVGSVLAAVGTALPETIIPIIAIVFTRVRFGRRGGDRGDPGRAVHAGHARHVRHGRGDLRLPTPPRHGDGGPGRPRAPRHGTRGPSWSSYAIAIGAAFLPPPFRPYLWLVAIGLLVLYAQYVRSHMREERDAELEDPQRAAAARAGRRSGAAPRTSRRGCGSSALQLLVALTCIIVGAVFFVGAVDHIAVGLGVNETLLALVIAPIATELPEKFNSVIWVRQGKDNLALGNITGAMVFQSAIPPSIALVFAPEAWTIGGERDRLPVGRDRGPLAPRDRPAGPRRRRLTGPSLLVGGAFYLVYLGVVIASMGGAG